MTYLTWLSLWLISYKLKPKNGGKVTLTVSNGLYKENSQEQPSLIQRHFIESLCMSFCTILVAKFKISNLNSTCIGMIPNVERSIEMRAIAFE